MKLSLCALGVAVLAGCSPSYAPDTYATRAVQQVNKVEPGIVVGFRQVLITATGTVGAVTGGAAGGVLGNRAGGAYGFDSALGAVGGTAVGSLVGTTLEHATADTTGWEYIVRKDNGEMLSVTQREETPLQLGQKVLVIGGSQARIVPDYSEPLPAAPAPIAEKPEKSPKAASRPSFPLLVVPLSSESTYTSAPAEAEPKQPPDAAPANDAPAATAAIVETITEPAPEATPAAPEASQPDPAEASPPAPAPTPQP